MQYQNPYKIYRLSRPPQSETVPARIFWFFMCLRQKNTLQPCLLPLLVLDFVVSMHFFTPPVIFISLLPAFNNSNDSLVYCAWQTNNVPARKSSGLCRLWRSDKDLTSSTFVWSRMILQPVRHPNDNNNVRSVNDESLCRTHIGIDGTSF